MGGDPKNVPTPINVVQFHTNRWDNHWLVHYHIHSSTYVIFLIGASSYITIDLKVKLWFNKDYLMPCCWGRSNAGGPASVRILELSFVRISFTGICQNGFYRVLILSEWFLLSSDSVRMVFIAFWFCQNGFYWVLILLEWFLSSSDSVRMVFIEFWFCQNGFYRVLILSEWFLLSSDSVRMVFIEFWLCQNGFYRVLILSEWFLSSSDSVRMVFIEFWFCQNHFSRLLTLSESLFQTIAETSSKDISSRTFRRGHFVDGHFVERTFCKRSVRLPL